MIRKKTLKFVVICGSTCSGIGKGVTISSIAALFKAAGYVVGAMKIDPYINIDAGTMNPYEHGEVYVLDDGGEVDLDLGNYERFLDIHLKRIHNLTTGKVYEDVIKAERKGKYLGKTVQIVPHVTDAIQHWINEVAKVPVDDAMECPEIFFVEVGGTVGDIESMIYFEAIRQLQTINGVDNVAIGMVSFVPQVGKDKEHKTKPAQHGVRELRTLGLQPDFLFCRSEQEMDQEKIAKLAVFTGVSEETIISVPDAQDTTEVPVLLFQKNVLKAMCQRLKLEYREPDMTFWKNISNRAIEAKSKSEAVLIAFVGKYIELQVCHFNTLIISKDAYISVFRAFDHASIETGIKVNLELLEAEELEDVLSSDSEYEKKQACHLKSWEILRKANGVFVPGGFGYRGIPGKLKAIKYARENKIPFLGICYGFQLSVIEWARNVMMKAEAISQEFLTDLPKNEKQELVIVYMPDQETDMLGGTMRLGSKQICIDDKESLAYKIYGSQKCEERHRHRYEVNPKMIDEIMASGLRFTGSDIRRERMEFVEVKDHPFFFGCQAHPEFKSKIGKPSPPYLAFVLAAGGQLEDRFKENKGFLNKRKDQIFENDQNREKVQQSLNKIQIKAYILFEILCTQLNETSLQFIIFPTILKSK